MKNTTMKIWIKTLSLVMAFVLGIGYICFSDGITANAASGNISSIPTTIKAYPISTGNNTPAYGYVGDTSKDGTIYAADLCTIKTIYSNGWILVTYPTSKNKTRTLYVKAKAFFNSTTYKTASITKYATAYRRSSGSATIGSVNAADKLVYVIGGSVKGRYQIAYKVTNTSTWKLGWVTTSAVKFDNTSTTVTNNNSSSWDYPMKNAYCTWSSSTNMSWANHRYGSSGGRNYHLGLDIYGSGGTVYAAADGVVKNFSQSNSGANGRFVIIEHQLNGKTIYSFYAHLNSINTNNVRCGQRINKGTAIGVAGGSGYKSNNYYGTHLHFAIVDSYCSSGGYWGYAYSNAFNGNTATYNGVTYYNPNYIVKYDRIP